MSVRIDKGRLGSGLEMTSMIDIVFLLMIFFLVASKLDEADRSIDVVLPHASAARPLTSRPVVDAGSYPTGRSCSCNLACCATGTAKSGQKNRRC